MHPTIIGRQDELEIFQNAMSDDVAHFFAVYGRRRVGKTFLIREYFKKEMCFEMTGLHDDNLERQLQNFTTALQVTLDKRKKSVTPQNWLAAFMQLISHLEKQKTNKKKVVFIDELPWLCTHKSGFMAGLEYFWNSWAAQQRDVILLVCGSAASWMIQNVVRNKGGLYNRITKQIRLLPFTLGETEDFLKSKGVQLNRYQIVQLFMATGGIPHYLKEAKRGQSATQIIDALCFKKNGLLYDEFNSLYLSLYDEAAGHLAIIRALAKRRQGITRAALLKETGLADGGSITRILQELDESGFIDQYYPFGKKIREKLIRITDLFSVFYLQFIEKNKATGSGSWQTLSMTPAYKAWSGFAFESVCMMHLPQIKKALGIAGVYTETASWISNKAATQGAQIDLLIDRKDFIINVCEMKFAQQPFIISKKYAAELQQKINAFRTASKTKKHIALVMLSTFGVEKNQYAVGLVENDLTIDALFERI